MKKIYFRLFLLIFIGINSINYIYSQGVAINNSGNAADGSAMLDVASINSGLLIPRMSSAQRTGIISPAIGLLVFQTDNEAGFYYYTGADWIRITNASDATGYVSGSGGPTAVAFWTGAQTLSSSINLYWDNTNNRLGLGVMGPQSQLHLTEDIQLGHAGYDDDHSIIYYLGAGNEGIVKFDYSSGGMGLRYVANDEALYIDYYSGTTPTPFVSFLQNTQRVGIGVPSPTAQLHTSGTVRFANYTSGTLQVDAGGNLSVGTGSSLFTPGTGLSWSGTTLNSVWTTSGNNIYNNNTANVGIGTTSPTAKLHVSAPASGSTIKVGRLGGQPSIEGTDSWMMIEQSGTNPLALNYYGSNDVVLVNGGGNVGINNTSPSYKLDVSGTGRFTGQVIIPVTPTADAHAASKKYVDDEVGAVLPTDNVTGTGTATRVAFWDGTNTLSSNANLYWDNSNNRLGIGTTNPGTELEVAGQVKITGGSPGAGKVLTSDGAGLATWEPVGGNTISASVTAGNWYRIAYNTGNRANAEFTLRDFISGGGHSTLNFRIGTSYNQATGMSFTLISHSKYGTSTFTKVRVLQSGTYDTQYLEVYCNRSGNVDFSIYDNLQSAGWVSVNWTAGSIPSGYTAREYDVDKLFAVGDYDDRFTINRGGNVGVGTPSPSTQFHTTGGVRFQGLSGTGSRFVMADANGNLSTSTAAGAGVVSGTGTSDYLARWTSANTLSTGVIQDNGSRIGIGTSPHSSYMAQIGGDVLLTSGWLRTTGSTGWYSQTYGGGWYMTDATWIRSYGNKSIYHNSGTMRTDGTFQVGSGGATLNVPNGGNFAYRSDVLFANTSGNVGIGTNSPGATLEVAGVLEVDNSGSGALAYFKGGSDDTSYEWIGFYSGETRQGIILYDGAWGSAGNRTNEFSITAENNNYLTLSSATGTSIIGGNVSVGQTFASFPLDVTTSSSTISRVLDVDRPGTNYGAGRATIYAYRPGTSGATNGGTAYSTYASDNGVQGYSLWGNNYSFGVAGFNYNDYTRCGGTLGAKQDGSYWASLGYKNSASNTYGAYWTNAGSGSGYMPNSGEISGIGAGGYGEFMGGWSRGGVIGFATSGELFALYNDGNSFTEGYSADIVNTNNGRQAAYSVTSNEIKVYTDGKNSISGNEIFVAFDENFVAIISNEELPNVTLTTLGSWAPIYIKAIDKNGFIVANADNSGVNVDFTWIAVAKRIDSQNAEMPSDLKDDNFNANFKDFMFDENILHRAAKPMWWDGNRIRFDKIPEKPIDINKKNNEDAD